ncbi:uroporphyrinogen-III synthase [Salisediminibacterium selenitireducens]|uniref:Uroporphyrinogen-III synthase n=1 Tax=Bacillus selenitireducens (strain ATCC 700615 / DSM 15326 / MLS10) TaxID=439292 RepID=D6XSZ8_BACIE|nr:uroporphyrinogen-III synthase [Salisediminibacterium selenitireducens]ADH98934.1 Uroporphyrinogen III synthase HEM4 [[Bacillus] selenitireducens MLS10]
MNGPLSGKRILNTRAPHQQKALTDRLTAWGADVVELPLIRVERVKGVSVREFREAFEAADVVVFTSRNAVEVTMDLLKEACQTDDYTRCFEGKVIAAVGEKTGDVLMASGLTPSIMPDVFEAGHLARSIVDQTAPGAEIFYPRSEKARKTLPKALTEAGRHVTELVIYTTKSQTIPSDKITELFEGDGLDVITFMSPTAVQSFFQQMDPALVPDDVRFAVIGEVTERALRPYVKEERLIVPERYTLEDMIRAIEEFYKRKDDHK